ncbi:HNH endonuclease [Mariniblastus sp.]|nr:HNH endonuclease [Mariniblastus sp.]
MTSYIPAEIRRDVMVRAAGRCEYCLIKESDTFLGFQVDHVIAEKHSGESIVSNLAYACTYCNRFKGSDIGSIAASTGEFTRFFNPRADKWNDHFRWEGFEIDYRTPIGEATSAILQFNLSDRILEREAIHEAADSGS